MRERQQNPHLSQKQKAGFFTGDTQDWLLFINAKTKENKQKTI